jgi:sec-independent protein translocase protein TatB
MLDLGWTEIFLIAGVAVLVIAPKDLPKAMRSVGKYLGQLKKMARGFQSQLNDAIKEADLEEIQEGVKSIAKVDPFANLKKEISKVGSDIKEDLKVLEKPVGSAATGGGTSAGSSTPTKTVAATSADKAPPAKADKAPPVKRSSAARKSAGAAGKANGKKTASNTGAAKKAPGNKSPAKARKKSASPAKPRKRTSAAKSTKPANAAKKPAGSSGEAKA